MIQGCLTQSFRGHVKESVLYLKSYALSFKSFKRRDNLMRFVFEVAHKACFMGESIVVSRASLGN